MALQLVTSLIFAASLGAQLACTACGGSAQGSSDAEKGGYPAAGPEPAGSHPAGRGRAALAGRTCDDCGEAAACNSLGVCTPDAWFCGPMYYNGGAADGCDCDCGIADPDCDIPNIARWCYGAGKPYQVDDCSACTAPNA